MLKVPYEQTLSPIIWEEVEEVHSRMTSPEYRVFPILHSKLIKNSQKEKGDYIGQKWGGEYLRAPELYWILREKCGKKFLAIEPNIGNIVTVSWSRRGKNQTIMASSKSKNAGAIPVLKSPREVNTIKISKQDSKTFLLTNLLPPNEKIICTPLIWDDIRGERHLCRLNADLLPFTHNFHGINIHENNNVELVCAILNSTITWLFIEILGRRGLGGGGIRLLVEDLKIAKILVDPSLFTQNKKQEIIAIFQKMAVRTITNINSEVKLTNSGNIEIASDRKAIDEIVFDALELTNEERNSVYTNLLDLVGARVQKSKSLVTRKVSKDLSEMEW